MIIKFSRRLLNNRYNDINIESFDTDSYQVPGDLSHRSFKLKAAIFHIPTDKKNTENGGHFICWQRKEEGWISISDNIGIWHDNFTNNLSFLYLLFFEKKIISNFI